MTVALPGRADTVYSDFTQLNLQFYYTSKKRICQYYMGELFIRMAYGKSLLKKCAINDVVYLALLQFALNWMSKPERLCLLAM